MTAEFYDVKNRKRLTTEVCCKKAYERNGTTRYAVCGKTADGRNLTKFVGKADWDATKAPLG